MSKCPECSRIRHECADCRRRRMATKREPHIEPIHIAHEPISGPVKPNEDATYFSNGFERITWRDINLKYWRPR